MINQIFSQDIFKLLTVFSLSPGSRFKRNELKQRTALNNVPLDKALNRLVTSGIIKKEGTYYCLNFENEYSKALIETCAKQHRQMKRLPLKVYFSLADIIMQASSLKNVEVYLFGSYSKLVFSEKSDIDLAILLSRQIYKKDLLKAVKKAEKTYGKRVEPHFFEKKRFYKNKKDPLVNEILKDGIKLI